MSGRGIRRRLEVTLVAVALVSVLVLSGVNYVFARFLIADSVEAQLSALRDTRVQAIERGATRLQTSVATLAVTPSVVAALEELTEGYRELDGALEPAQVAELEAGYDAALEPLRAAGREVPTDSLLPASERGQYVQYHYIAENPDPFDDRDRLDDAGDGSRYSAVHAEYHPLLRSLMRTNGVSDLLLVDYPTREVVYSTKKRVDVGTSVTDGPWADTQLGAVVDKLSQTTVGDTVISDTSFYVPAQGQAVVFLASAIRSGSELIGAIVTELPVDALTDVVNAQENWDLLGLDGTGDVYLVGPDGRMRTDPRAWLTDPEVFLSEYLDRSSDERLVEQMRLAGSAALTETVDNKAVESALAGDTFVGTVKNYRGDTTFAASGPVMLGDQQWVVVIEQSRSEATEGLGSLLRGTLVVVAVLLPITALLGWLLARNLTRPFGLLVDAAGNVARGEPPPDMGMLGNNELGDVGRQLEIVAARLRDEEASIVAEEAQINQVLGEVVPPRLIDRVRRGEQRITDLLDTATAVSFMVEGIPEASGSDQDTVFEITQLLAAEVDRLSEEFGVERVRRSPTNALFVSGMRAPDACVEAAVAFASAVMSMIADAAEEYGQPMSIRAGLASGDVASGVIGQHQVTFSVWGEPVSTAFTLASMAGPGEILADASVARSLGEADGSSWQLDRREGLSGLAEDVEAWTIGRPQPDDG